MNLIYLKKHRRPSRWLPFLTAIAWSSIMAGQVAAQVSLVSVQPANGSTDVPLNSTIVFTFSKPMDDSSLVILAQNPFINGSMAFSANITTSSLTPSWNGELTVLTLTYAGDLPAGALITWTINPANRAATLISEDVDVVPTTTGSFTTTGESCDPDGIPDDFGGVSLIKSLTYEQTSAAAPTLKNDEPPTFGAFVNSPAVNTVTDATLTGPGNQDIPFQGFGGSFLASEEFATQAAMDADYPAGTYAFTLTRETGGPNQFSMQMPASTAYPPIPQVSNFAAAQTIDPAQDFTLNFNALTGASGSDFIGITINDGNTTVLSAPDLCIPLLLANTATSFTIPADTLTAGKSYTLRLTFSRTFYNSTTAPPNFASFGALQRQTVLTIVTTGGGGGPQPQLAVAGFQSGFFALNVTGMQPATNYRVQYSSTFLPNSWQPLQDAQNVTTTTPMPIFDLTSTSTTGRRFYRVITP